jgi:hypothetical protein
MKPDFHKSEETNYIYIAPFTSVVKRASSGYGRLFTHYQEHD